MKIETIQKFEFRIRILSNMKDDYLYLLQRAKSVKGVDMSAQIERYKDCLHVLDCVVKSYIKKLEKKNVK